MWQNFEKVEDPPHFLTAEDQAKCFYTREYASGQKYSYSEANNLISNLKKGVALRGTNQWPHKRRAIQRFAAELYQWFKDINFPYHICSIPSSKRRDHEEYDSRLDDVLSLVAAELPNAIHSTPIIRNVTLRAAHLSPGDRPTIQEHYESMEWVGLEIPPAPVIIIDDVITSGASFKACQRHFRENAPEADLHGAFWCKTIWLHDENDDDGEF